MLRSHVSLSAMPPTEEATLSGLQAHVVPRTVVMPKSYTKLNRICRSRIAAASDLSCGGSEEYCSTRLARLGLQVREPPQRLKFGFLVRARARGDKHCTCYVYDEESSNNVSAAVCAHTIDMSMDLPLWFAGVNVEDRPEDDDMTAYQESTIICIAHAFRAAVQMGANVDGGFISHDCLSRVADCFRLLLVASMWLMRMAGDNLHSHYEAFYFAKLVSKPMLVAFMHRSFEHQPSVVRATNVVMERLGKANTTLGEYPKYIPEWVSCDIVFGHDASITGPEDVKRLDWLGSPPLEEDDDDAGKDDA
ncbi:hypothetical protein CBR_g9163 [Chara braunii]|uniref:SWIM-type domain-containing protein n=1 Tax=Chara braunii TaxID=69332 RepID=A0A388KNZ3_CHABU|nr:hypothetical protein CBR_g9163 [Chara braunii]|eukprot:GBG71755.1 hypothetical protein CBR_g9163 [Chara braunii]